MSTKRIRLTTESYSCVDAMEDGSEVGEESKLVSGLTEAFSLYKPAHLKLGVQHSQTLCEGSGLSCIKPPEITYNLKMEPCFYEETTPGQKPLLSNSQLEAIIYSCQAHAEDLPGTTVRKGFYLGDGTGTGKSRTLAGLAYENWKSGVKECVWITVNDEMFDGIEAELKNFFNVKEIRIVRATVLPVVENRSVFTVVMVTYSNLVQRGTPSIGDKLKSWMGVGYDGLLFFDQSHFAKGADDPKKKSATGGIVVDLQDKNPRGRILYASATGASRPYHLMYLVRLGFYGPGTCYKNAEEFKYELDRRGVGALELLAMEMKQKGVFLSRQLSYQGVVVMSHNALAREDFAPIYNRCCQLWALLIKYQADMINEENKKRKMKDGIGSGPAIKVGQKSGPFFAASLSFFGLLIMSSKLRKAEDVARMALKDGKSVVIGVQSTGEARFKIFQKESWNKGMPFSFAREILRSTMVALGIKIGCPKAYLANGEMVKIGEWDEQDEIVADKYVESGRFDCVGSGTDECEPIPESNNEEVAVYDEVEEKLDTIPSTSGYVFRGWPSFSVADNVCSKIRKLNKPRKVSWSYDEAKKNPTAENLARLFHELALFLPINPVDAIMYRMQRESKEGEGDGHRSVLLSGRRYDYIFNERTNDWEKRKSCGLKKGKELFMNGPVRVCIISAVAGLGLDLHSSEKCKNKSQRVHITLQYAFGPENFLQQLGRTHRSQQVVEPEIHIIKSAVDGERRYVSVINKRLEHLGAICNGQSRSSPLEAKMADIMCTKAGLDSIIWAIMQFIERDPVYRIWANDVGLKPTLQLDYKVSTLEKVVSRVFNRNLMMPLELQEIFLDMVETRLKKLVAKTDESSYCPIVEIPGSDVEINLLATTTLDTIVGRCIMRKFRLNRMCTWSHAEKVVNDGKKNGKQVKLMRTKPCNEALVAVEADEGTWNVRFTWNKIPMTMTNDELNKLIRIKNFTEDIGNYGSAFWNMAMAQRDRVGCEHKQLYEPCKNDPCFYRWAMYDILVFSEYTSDIITKLEDVYRLPLHLARVSWHQDKELHKTTGVLVKNSNVDEVESMLQRVYRVRK